MARITRKTSPKVVCALSGGVDSAVAAAVLKKQKVEVIGIFMKFWSEPTQDGLIGVWNRCCSREAEKRARWVASILDIPFYVYDFRKEFKKRVVDYFLAEYKKGRTPNPCVVCNKEIKFGLLLEKSLASGSDFVASGHYARVKDGYLFQAKDKQRDQSYFLWRLNQAQLKHILFPLADYKKSQVKNLAKKFKLPVFDIPESREICFIKTTVNDFLEGYLDQNPGKIVNKMGEEIAEHRGLAFYTIGQRKGLGLKGGPWWVLGKNQQKNVLIVTKNEKDLYKKELEVENINWVSEEKPIFPLKIKAKIRYKHKEAPATLLGNKVIFDQPQKAITPGQSIVFYKGEEVLGGGIIT